LAVWENAAEEYFVRESAANIVWHTEAIIGFTDTGPLISVKDLEAGASSEGATQIFIYAEDADFLFANSTAAFEKLNLNIVGARIFTSSKNFCMDTYTVLETNGKPVGETPARITEIETVLRDYLLSSSTAIAPAKYRRTRKERYFNNPIETTLGNPAGKTYSTLEVNCPDQPGVLATLGKVFADKNIKLIDARITTLGERVEDLFFIKGEDGGAITDAAFANRLQDEIKSALERRLSV
jgi:[protein-PII] uridylyltransferase